MERENDAQRDAEWIIRRAAELGHDPQRVARALRHRPTAAAEPGYAGSPGPEGTQSARALGRPSWGWRRPSAT